MLGDRTRERILIGMTAPSTVPCLTRSKTSSERAHGTSFARGNMASAASWLKEPSSPGSHLHCQTIPVRRGLPRLASKHQIPARQETRRAAISTGNPMWLRIYPTGELTSSFVITSASFCPE